MQPLFKLLHFYILHCHLAIVNETNHKSPGARTKNGDRGKEIFFIITSSGLYQFVIPLRAQTITQSTRNNLNPLFFKPLDYN